MNDRPIYSISRLARRWGIGSTVLLALSGLARTSYAQSQVMHQLSYPNRLPGTTVTAQHRAQPYIAGYFQPVRVVAPSGCQVSIAADGGLTEPVAPTVLAGLQVGPVYRLSVAYTDRGQQGLLYPTLEVLDRLFPPDGETERFPIVVEITADDLRQATAGHLVTKVIYLEDPRQAIAQVDRPDEQRWFDALPHEDPLKMADDIGKPMAILRIGSRTPGTEGPDPAFLFGSPPVTMLAEPASYSEARMLSPPPASPSPSSSRGVYLQIRD